ncbi:MAG: L-histidine N(alpha)-methyltransferase, partial [Planctomycetota bacterium]
INASALKEAGARLTSAHPELEVLAIAAEYGPGLEVALRRVLERKLVLFLGGNIGNFERPAAAAFLRDLAARLDPQDAFLIGVDLRKDRKTLELAYDDPAGVTARFNLNLLARINRELGGDFDLDRFRHEATYDERQGVVRMHLVSVARQTVRIRALRRSFLFEAGERIHTEDSTKYSLEEIGELAEASGMRLAEHWTDEFQRFSLNLFERVDA